MVPSAQPNPQKRKPWTRKGVLLGFIRDGVYYIDRYHHGRRYRPSTGKRSAEAAWVEYQRFEVDPPNYKSPIGAVENTWDAEATVCLGWMPDNQRRTDKHIDTTAGELAVWCRRPGFTSIHTFTREDINATLEALGRGELTGRYKSARDKDGNNILRPDGTPEQVRLKTNPPGRSTRNRYLAALTKFMNWARDNDRTKNLADKGDVKLYAPV